MRQLVFVLVLANLAFAAWTAWFAPLTRVGHRTDEGLPSITLLSEVPADLRSSGAVTEPLAEQADAAEANVPATPEADGAAGEPIVAAADAAQPPGEGPGAGATGRCTSVGPFRELSQAANAAATLRTSGYEPTQRVAEGDIWIGYWVYIQAIPTEAEANAILAKVRAQGIDDSYVIPNSDSGNLVSLGVFSEISGVSRRREEVRALGYEPKIVDRTRRATVYWVDVVLAPDQTLDFNSLQTPGRITRLEQRPCEAPAA
jgi:cell division septation protein DedD